MMNFQAVYLPIGVSTFHLESAQTEMKRSRQLLASLTEELVCPETMLLSLNELNEFLDRIHPDLIILQNTTFANASYASEVLKRFSCPILLWTLREPVIDGSRLRLNSLTGTYSAANAIHAFRSGEFEYVFGSPKEQDVANEIGAVIRAARVYSQLKRLKLAAIGDTPQGFGFGRALDAELLYTFGVTLETIEVRELIECARSFTDEECSPYLAEAKQRITGLENLPERNIKDFARLYKAYTDYVIEHHIGALASRCWPDFFTSYGTPVCSVLSLLGAKGICASCESDVYGALSMYIGSKLTGKAAFFGDPVSMDEEEGTITYWHCGMAACSLAREDTGARAGVHPNRQIGPTMDFGCRACEQVTIFRVGRKPNGTFRFFIAEGEALNKPKQFGGVSIVVKTKTAAKEIVRSSVKAGWEPHFTVLYGAVAKELEMLAHMTGLEIHRY